MVRSLFQLLAIFLLHFSGVRAQNSSMKLLEENRLDLPGISIRAIQVLDSSELWFAGSNGKIGRVKNGELLLDSIRYEKRNPSFRSIAFNGEKVYVLSIENPALLYSLSATESGINSKLVYLEADEKVFYDSMRFLDNQRGIAMGDPVNGCLSVILTQDGGLSWKKLSCDQLPEINQGEAAFAASNTNLATAGNTAWMVSGGKSARIWISSDQGQNWKVVPSPLQQGQKMTGIFTAAFYDQDHGIVMGGNWEDKKDRNRTKARTMDGGLTWHLIGDGKDPGYISCVQFIPESEGKELMAVSTEGIYYSVDAGEQWTKISDEGFYSIRFQDKDAAWLSGNEKIVKFKLRRQ